MRSHVLAAGLAALTLSACIKPDHFEMEPPSVKLEAKESVQQVRAVARDRRDQVHTDVKPVKWESLDESIATVDDAGTIRAVAPGITRVRAINGELVGEVVVDVDFPVKFEVAPLALALAQDGDPVKPEFRVLDVRGKPMRDRAIRGKCQNEKVCTIDPDGKVWPHDAGETVAVFSVDDFKTEVKIVVAKGGRR